MELLEKERFISSQPPRVRGGMVAIPRGLLEARRAPVALNHFAEDPAARRDLAEVLDSLDVTVLMVTHDLPFAWQLCPRSVILDAGRIRADAATPEVLADSALLAQHRLELPFGFDPGPRTQ